MNIGKERLVDSWIAVDIKTHVRIAEVFDDCAPQIRTVYFETIARPPMICSPSKVSKLCSRCGRHGPGSNKKGELLISCQ
jgi:hypothetical protein